MNKVLLVVLIPLGFMLLGCVLIGIGIWLRKLAAASKSWPASAGKILVSRVMEMERDGSDARSTDYQAEVEYEYAVGGQSLRGKRVQFGGRTRTSRSRAQAVIARYPVGAAVDVFYDPLKPAQCTLERTAAGSTVALFIIGAAFLTIPLLIMIVMLVTG